MTCGRSVVFSGYPSSFGLDITEILLKVVLNIITLIHKPTVHTRFCKLQKGCTRPTAASDKVYQLLAHGRWFSAGTPASSTTKTGRHDIAEILLKVALNIN